MTIELAPIGERLRERTEQLQPPEVDQQFGYAHANLSGALAAPFEQLAEVVDPPDPYVPWEPLFNVNICPDWALPWLAQVVGVRVPSSATPDQMRQMIVGLALHKRGTVAAIRTAGDIFLIEPKIVYFRERDAGEPYALEIVVKESSLPEVDLPLQNQVEDPSPINFDRWKLLLAPGTVPDVGVSEYLTEYEIITETNAPPTRRGIKYSHTFGKVGTQYTFVADAVSNKVPPPTPGRKMSGVIWIKAVKGINNPRFGVAGYNEAGDIVLTGGIHNPQPVDGVWKGVYIQETITDPDSMPPDLIPPGEGWGNFAPCVTFTVTDPHWEMHFSSALIDEMDAGRVVDYSDPRLDPILWHWDGPPDDSRSTRTRADLVKNAYGSQIPAGILYRYRTVLGWDYEQLSAEGGPYSDLPARFDTYRDLAENERTS